MSKAFQFYQTNMSHWIDLYSQILNNFENSNVRNDTIENGVKVVIIRINRAPHEDSHLLR